MAKLKNMKISLFIFYSLLFTTIICSEDNKEEDLSSDIFSGIMKGFYYAGGKIAGEFKEFSKAVGKAGDSLVNGVKGISKVYMARADAIVDVALEKKKILNSALKGYDLMKDKTLYYKTLQELNYNNLIKESTKIVDKSPFLYVNKIGPISKTNLFEKIGGTVGEFCSDSIGKVIKVLPYASSAYNGYQAVKRFSKGEIVGGSIKMAESVVSLIPGVSTFTSLLPSVASFVYDLSK